MGPVDQINYEEGSGVDVEEERGCGLLQNVGRFLRHSMTSRKIVFLIIEGSVPTFAWRECKTVKNVSQDTWCSLQAKI
jgi:hypothetical protein